MAIREITGAPRSNFVYTVRMARAGNRVPYTSQLNG